MFEGLSEKLERSFKILKGQGYITEINVAETLKEVRKALLDADVNFKIAKEAQDNTTQTNITQLANDEVIDELARMLGSDEITQTVRENAKELISTANEKKKH